MYRNNSLKTYLDDLAAKKPAPGGGVGGGLDRGLRLRPLSMACNFTIGKDKYRDVQPQIQSALKEAESLRKRFLSLVDLDVRAYQKVFNSRKAKENIYQKNLIAATRVPLEIAILALKGYGLCPLLRKIANKYLISDVYVGEELLKSCFKSAEFNVIINLPHIKDKSFISQTKKQLPI